MSRLIATFGFVGLLRPAPGTWGSLAGLVAAWPIHVLGGPIAFMCATIVVSLAGYWAAGRYMADTGRHDAPEIVIDEVAGQWIALWPVSIGAAHAGADLAALWPGIVAAFVFFRLFDILKPGPIGWADRQPGAWGVMLDDIIAGWLAALLVAVTAFVAHGIIGI